MKLDFDISNDNLLERAREAGARDGRAYSRTAAERWLGEYLSMNPGAKSAETKRDAIKAGITERTLARARTSLGVEISYQGMPAVSVWSLPDHRGGTMTLTLEDGTEVPLTRDAHGFIARHDGQTFHLTATITGTGSLTPAKWVATR